MTPSEIKPKMKFNHWEVIKYDHTNKHRIKYFLCKCDVCGTKRAIRGTSLIAGTSKACSKACLDNIVGQRFGRWIVLSKDKSRTGYYWCKCDCGIKRSVKGSSLKNGMTKSCGCARDLIVTYNGVQQETKEKYRQYVGQKFGNLTILQLKENSDFYECKCDCGKIVNIAPYNVISKNTTSCGCKRKETLRQQQKEKYEKLVGTKINYLTIQKCYYKNNTFWFDCLCDCGNFTTIQATKVKSNYIQSCGCIKSKGEENMAKILNEHQISYKREYKFDDCRDKQPLPFDFAIFNKQDELIGLIELNGQQHYSEGGWNTKERLLYIQKHDKIKHRFCEYNEIPFLVIPYQYYNIDKLKEFLMTSDFWQIITKNFND